MKKKPHGSFYVAYVQESPETANPPISSLRVSRPSTVKKKILQFPRTPVNSQLQSPSPYFVDERCNCRFLLQKSHQKVLLSKICTQEQFCARVSFWLMVTHAALKEPES